MGSMHSQFKLSVQKAERKKIVHEGLKLRALFDMGT